MIIIKISRLKQLVCLKLLFLSKARETQSQYGLRTVGIRFRELLWGLIRLFDWILLPKATHPMYKAFEMLGHDAETSWKP